MSSEEQGDLSFLARLYYEISHFEESMDCIEKLSAIKPKFSYDDLMLLNVVTKARVDPERSTIRTLLCYADSEKKENRIDIVDRIDEYYAKVTQDLLDFAHRTIDLLEQNIIPNIDDVECLAFSKKMLGDLFRYITETGHSTELENAKEKSMQYYMEAIKIADDLHPCSPVRLNIMLNYSVFVFDGLKKQNDAIDILTNILQNDRDGLASITGERLKEAENIFSIMENNLKIWTGQIEST